MELTRESILGNVKSFHLPLYNYFISKRYPDRKINSALYSLRDINMTSFIAPKEFDNAKDIMDVCMKSMDFILKEIFNPDIPFKPTAKSEDERRCGYWRLSRV